MPAGTDIARRTFLAALAAAGAGAVFWPGRGSRIPRGRVVLSYWEKWTGREGAAMQAVVDRYNASQDRAWVQLVPIGDITPKTMVAIGGGDPPDLAGLYSYSIPGFAEARAAMPLSEFRHLGEIDPEGYTPAVRDLLWQEGRQWGGVNTCYVLAMYYNRALFREAGHDPDRPPRTIEELDDLAARLTVIENGRIARAGFLQNVPGWWPYFWPLLFGSSLYDEASDRATIAEAAGVECFRWIRSTAERFGPAPTREFAASFARSIHSAQDPFISGRMAMIAQGTWLGAFINDHRPDLDYACCPAPVPAPLYDPHRPIGLLEADVLMIPRGCRHPEEAYRFLKFTQAPDVQEQLALAHCKPSPMSAVSESFMARHPNRGIAVHDAIARSERVRILPRTRSWKEYDDLITSAFEAVWSGAEPASELRAVQDRAQQLIDTAAARHRVRALKEARP